MGITCCTPGWYDGGYTPLDQWRDLVNTVMVLRDQQRQKIL